MVTGERKLARLEVEISRLSKEVTGGLGVKRRGRGVVSWNITQVVDRGRYGNARSFQV